MIQTLPTKAERNINIYQTLIRDIEKGYLFTLCHSLIAFLSISDYAYSYVYAETGGIMFTYFPELWNERPAGVETGKTIWYPLNAWGMEKRKQALNNAIKTLQDENKNSSTT